MRYINTEHTILAGFFDSGKDVTIKVIKLSSDSIVTTTTPICRESQHIAGVYLWNTSNMIIDITTFTDFVYEMTDGTKKFFGKFVLGGYTDKVLTDVSEARVTTLLESNKIKTMVATLPSDILDQEICG